MPDPLVLNVGPEDAGQRLDKYLVRMVSDASRSALTRLIRDGRVLVNDHVPRKPGHALEARDTVVVERLPAPAMPGGPAPERMPLHVVYEDEDLLAIDKPAGIPVHPGPGHTQGTLVNALLAREGSLSHIGGDERPGIVHRLDKDTSGLLLVAKTDAAHESLARQLQDRTVGKVYIALVRGRLQPSEGIIEAPIARDPDHRQRMAVVDGGREAVTEYQVSAYLNGYTLLEARPRTGRPHQIRVHFASLRHPVAGDRVYARSRGDPVPRLFLHAHRLTFQHPRTGVAVELASPLAEDLAAALRAMAPGGEVLDRVARLTRVRVE